MVRAAITIAAYILIHSPTRWLGLKVRSHPALSLHSLHELGELSQWQYRDDSAININVDIIIIIIIVFVVFVCVC